MKSYIRLWIQLLVFILAYPECNTPLMGQSFTLGWSGPELVTPSIFYNPSNWTTNVPNPELGDACSVSANGDTLSLNWTFGTGNRYKWAQCYLYFNQPISLENYDLFGFDLEGMPAGGDVGFELKFEDGVHQTAVRWDALAGLDRWAERISASKKQFEDGTVIDWSNVKVISFAVYAQASTQYTGTDLGVVHIRKLVGTKMEEWERANEQEFIDPMEYVSIKENAINALVNRQQATGLLTTWTEDNSSWLYGQGLALKALSIKGEWNSGIPVNSAAIAAEKLALFLASHQQPEGYWPRAWNSVTGQVNVLTEADGTVWMGDFPWTITGLQAYYKRSGDIRVNAAIQLGLQFLRSLVMPDGKFYTINPVTVTKYAVTSCEAYAAAILCLQESGDTARAGNLISYIREHGWDEQLRYWREGTYSDRIVLFANTWMSYYLFREGETQQGLDALSLAGKVLYTTGNGESFGMDGIVPLAIWNEGTLSYMADGGPGSISLFEELIKYIHPDGMVSHYNENLGVMGGIWAVDWHSLDGTSWLYFVSAGLSPFDVVPGIPAAVSIQPAVEDKGIIASPSFLPGGQLVIRLLSPYYQDIELQLALLDGRIIYQKKIHGGSGEVSLPLGSIVPSFQYLILQVRTRDHVEYHRLLMMW